MKWSKVKVSQLRSTLCDLMNYTVHGILQARILEWVAFPFSGGSSQPRDQTQVSCTAGGFFTSLKGSPRILEWVAYPFSSGSSCPRNRTRVSCITGGFFTSWAMREALLVMCVYIHTCRYFCDSVEKLLWLLWHLPVLHCIFSSHWLSSFAWP